MEPLTRDKPDNIERRNNQVVKNHVKDRILDQLEFDWLTSLPWIRRLLSRPQKSSYKTQKKTLKLKQPLELEVKNRILASRITWENRNRRYQLNHASVTASLLKFKRTIIKAQKYPQILTLVENCEKNAGHPVWQTGSQKLFRTEAPLFIRRRLRIAREVEMVSSKPEL